MQVVTNRTPLTPITDESAETYARDGAVCLRNVFGLEWVKLLHDEALRIDADRIGAGLIPTAGNKHMCRVSEAFRRYVFESPAAEATARVLRSRELRFFYDELFVKAPKVAAPTYWHTDSGGWPVSGSMVPSVWMPLTPVRKHFSLEVLAGSHRDPTRWWNTTRNSRLMIRPDDRPLFPDFESRRDDASLRFLAWDMEPGDLLIVHPAAFHFSSGNPADSTRVALSTRWFGDDIRWDPRPECVNHAGVSFDEMVKGQRPGGAVFPLIWSADGRRDDDSNFPRAFATSWSLNPRDYEVAEVAAGEKRVDVNYQDRLAPRMNAGR